MKKTLLFLIIASIVMSCSSQEQNLSKRSSYKNNTLLMETVGSSWHSWLHEMDEIIKISKYLILNGADIYVKDEKGTTVNDQWGFFLTDEEKLIESIKEGDLNEIEKLLKKGVDPNCISPHSSKEFRYPATTVAVNELNLNALKLLVTYGADLSKRSSYRNRTLLMEAVGSSWHDWLHNMDKIIKISKYLMLNGADIYAKDNKGWTINDQLQFSSNCFEIDPPTELVKLFATGRGNQNNNSSYNPCDNFSFEELSRTEPTDFDGWISTSIYIRTNDGTKLFIEQIVFDSGGPIKYCYSGGNDYGSLYNAVKNAVGCD